VAAVNVHGSLSDFGGSAVARWAKVGHAGVQRGVAAIAADLENVVALRLAGVEMICTPTEIADEVDQLDVGLQADDLAGISAQLGQGDRYLVAGHDVGVGA
jgi:hypothetical protein